MKYPKIVKLDDPKLKGLIVQKGDLILEGRKKSEEIDLIKESQEAVNKQLIEAESKVEIKDLHEKGNNIVKQMEKLADDLNVIKQEVFDRVKAYTDQSMRDQYETLDKQRKKAENDLNKIGHKVQKVKDKILPLVQKLGSPHLEDEFEDYATTRLDDDGTPILEIFSHLENWKDSFRKNNK